ncbi:MAG: hypothetical protein A3C62_02425 [Candidatus Zambryskibacteria bacterium RIFCSPHIGHO2_02_FULL_39_16]|uniref:Uncharacterized protein n=1 Tax=Candidatus Zambryskibacteria bacterium RIFCSPLOWO2_02_FULL_39_14 TaxID=1802769 RepID=A0A1G2UJ00_9BACT|nr:MAG: hypothetical protein A3C62_02425 [Candidatus Zambryskibacteria bacterium RIFCSPHIGHO2_02_FULL_39_16]OHB09142.1 MAG: hypothetical protein A3I86_01700 [Candidatus Zambryskibacteria bacterium RIFCSPLOWO2_02_FULL_39_14]
MKDFFKKIWTENKKVRKFIGVTLVIVGILSVITPFTPVGFLLVFGLEILGIRILFWNNLINWFKHKINKNKP